jgi:hypothetical protein
MTLKKTILDLLDAEQLRSVCTELEVEGDRRSATAMRDGLARAKRAKPERLIDTLRVEQIRKALEAFGKTTDGNRAELVVRLFEAGGRTGGPTATEPTVEPRAVARPWAGPSVRDDATAAQSVHDTLAVQRPDAGLQDHFVARREARARLGGMAARSDRASREGRRSSGIRGASNLEGWWRPCKFHLGRGKSSAADFHALLELGWESGATRNHGSDITALRS